MTSNSPHTKIPTIIGLLLALILSGGYWSLGSRPKEARAVAQLFYVPLLKQGISLDGHYVPDHLVTGQFSEWTHMLSREALIRWHLEAESPGALARLERRWRHGLWTPPDHAALTMALSDLDASWQEQRIAAGKPIKGTPDELAATGWQFQLGGGQIEPDADGILRFEANGEASIRLVAPAIRTELLGSRLILTFSAAKGPDPENAATLYWSTKQLTESGMRRQLGKLRAIGDSANPSPAGMADVAFDLLNEPGWLVSGAEATMLRIDLHGVEGPVEIRELRGADALPPTGDSAVAGP